MIFRPFYYDTGCAAYVFGCGSVGLGAVVDPQECDIDAYVVFATKKGLRITHVIDTHVHADHRSGGHAFAERTGAAYTLHRSADVAFASARSTTRRKSTSATRASGCCTRRRASRSSSPT